MGWLARRTEGPPHLLHTRGRFAPRLALVTRQVTRRSTAPLALLARGFRVRSHLRLRALVRGLQPRRRSYCWW